LENEVKGGEEDKALAYGPLTALSCFVCDRRTKNHGRKIPSDLGKKRFQEEKSRIMLSRNGRKKTPQRGEKATAATKPGENYSLRSR